MDYVLEYRTGAYVSFTSMADVDVWRNEHKMGGVLWTHDGHRVNEEKAREMEKDYLPKG